MRAAVLSAVDSPLEICDVEISDPGPGQVLVDIAACGVCHSDLSVIDGSFPAPLPIVLGHEAAGRVAAVGSGVTSVAVGDSVVITPAPSCGRCYWCVRGQRSICADTMGSLATGTFPDGRSPLRSDDGVVYRGLSVGAFAEQSLVQESAVVPIPADVPLEVACVIGCAVQTGVGAVINTAEVPEGAAAVVLGAGAIGLSVTQGLRLAGASTVVVVDPVAERRAVAESLGATVTVDPGSEAVAAVVADVTGGIGPDFAFEAAGSTALVEQAIGLVRPGGTAVCVGAPPFTDGVSIPAFVAFAATEKKLIGCLLGSCDAHRDIPRLLSLWKAGRIDLEALITNRVPLDRIGDAFDAMRSRSGIRTVVDVG